VVDSVTGDGARRARVCLMVTGPPARSVFFLANQHTMASTSSHHRGGASGKSEHVARPT